ncbi:hypothetical protein BDV10DRAFT_179472 [Aspergillus recurvatus]
MRWSNQSNHLRLLQPPASRSSSLLRGPGLKNPVRILQESDGLLKTTRQPPARKDAFLSFFSSCWRGFGLLCMTFCLHDSRPVFLKPPLRSARSTAIVKMSKSRTSTDGNCGANSETNATCLNSTFGNCCSSKGFCGSTTAYCGEGCQLEFGTCNDASVQTVSTTGSCGATLTSNVTCLGSQYGDCCSRMGYCGGNASYCGDGCQSGFGSCEVSSSTSNPTSSPLANLTATADPNPDPEQSTGGGGLSKGAIAGISVGSIVGGLAILALLGWFFMRRRRSTPVPEPEFKKDPSQVETVVVGHEMAGNGRAMHEMEAKAPTHVPYELPGSH